MRFICFMLLILTQTLFSYERNPYVSEEIWDKVSPYFLPEDHPLKEKLDEIFTKSRAIVGIESMKKAGFGKVAPQKYTQVVVARHEAVEGYIFKIYLDAQRYHKKKTEWYYWIKRITGARAIQQMIDEKGWHDIFKVPKKWVYPLPCDPCPPKDFVRKNFILVEEDMDIVDNKTNYDLWGSEIITHEILDHMYYMTTELGLWDCAKPDNAPFSRDGRIAFVDTQSVYEWPIRYDKLTSHLNKENKAYWKELIKKN